MKNNGAFVGIPTWVNVRDRDGVMLKQNAPMLSSGGHQRRDGLNLFWRVEVEGSGQLECFFRHEGVIYTARFAFGSRQPHNSVLAIPMVPLALPNDPVPDPPAGIDLPAMDGIGLPAMDGIDLLAMDGIDLPAIDGQDLNEMPFDMDIDDDDDSVVVAAGHAPARDQPGQNEDWALDNEDWAFADEDWAFADEDEELAFFAHMQG